MSIKSYRDLLFGKLLLIWSQRFIGSPGNFQNRKYFGLPARCKERRFLFLQTLLKGMHEIPIMNLANFSPFPLVLWPELETQLIIAERLEYVGKEMAVTLLAKTDAVGKKLRGLLKSVKIGSC